MAAGMKGSDYAQVFDTGDSLELNIAPATFNERYKLHVLLLIQAFNASITGNLTDITPRIRARSCVIAILDQEMKNKLLDAYDADLDDIRAKTDIDNEHKSEMMLFLAQNVVSKVYDWLDVDMGLWHKQRIGKI
jgi:hypothetical protein